MYSFFKRIIRPIGVIVLLTIMLPTPVSSAKTYEKVQRTKKHLFWGGPKKETAEAQLVYTDKLKQRGKIRKACKQYRKLVDAWPGSSEAAEAQYEYAVLLHTRGKTEKAFEEYKFLLDRYPGQTSYNDVLNRMLEIAKQKMKAKSGRIFFGGFTDPLKAIPYFESIVNYAPGWETTPETCYLIGRAYDQAKEYEMAVKAYADTQYRYPDSPFAERAAFDKSYTLYVLAQEKRKDDHLAEAAWTSFTLYLQTWPDSERADKAKQYRNHLYTQRAKKAYEKARFYDKAARNPTAALLSYRRFLQQFPNSGWTTLAEMRIQELTIHLEQKNAKK